MAKDELIFLIQRYGYARRNGTHQGKKSAEWMREIETALEATGPERDLAEQTLEKLEWLARQGNDPVWKGVHVNYCPVTEEFTYFGPAMLDSDLTRAAVLELLREKGAKEDTMSDKAPVEGTSGGEDV